MVVDLDLMRLGNGIVGVSIMIVRDLLMMLDQSLRTRGYGSGKIRRHGLAGTVFGGETNLGWRLG